MPKRKRRRKKRYHTGTYTSTKTGKDCKYRSGWELLLMGHLDADIDVLDWGYEALVVPYVSNAKTGRLRKYYPDFVVDYADGHQEVIEVKPSRKVHQLKIQKKLLAGGEWCRAHGVTFRVITELDLRSMGLM